MANAEEIIAALSQGISTLDSNTTGSALNNTDDLEHAVHTLEGTNDYTDAVQILQTLRESLRTAQGAEQQLREVLSNAQARFHG